MCFFSNNNNKKSICCVLNMLQKLCVLCFDWRDSHTSFKKLELCNLSYIWHSFLFFVFFLRWYAVLLDTSVPRYSLTQPSQCLERACSGQCPKLFASGHNQSYFTPVSMYAMPWQLIEINLVKLCQQRWILVVSLYIHTYTHYLFLYFFVVVLFFNWGII